MNKTARHLFRVLCALAIATVSLGTAAHEGEDHSAASAGAAGGAARPRVEASSEDFELVGVLREGELSILINRFATNEPVAGATVEVESGNVKAAAAFRRQEGDYVVTQEAFVKAVSTPGAHPMVISIVAGADADLLEGALKVPEPPHEHASLATDWRTWLAGAGAAIVLAAGAWHFLRRRARARSYASGSTA